VRYFTLLHNHQENYIKNPTIITPKSPTKPTCFKSPIQLPRSRKFQAPKKQNMNGIKLIKQYWLHDHNQPNIEQKIMEKINTQFKSCQTLSSYTVTHLQLTSFKLLCLEQKREETIQN